jgi:hypothetical protein
LLNRRHHIGGQALEAGSKERKEYHSVSNRGPALSSHNAIPLQACRLILRVRPGRPSQSWRWPSTELHAYTHGNGLILRFAHVH